MIVVEDGAAYALTELSWLAFLEGRAAGSEDRVSTFGCEVGAVLGELAEIVGREADFLDNLDDPFADLIVTDGAIAVALSPDDWLSYIGDFLAGQADPLADYGTTLGQVAPPLDRLTGVCAEILAAGLRSARVALGADLPSPAGVAKAA